ncbi:hypothetical protein Tco_0753428, partial [Tanacetum coccineum]
GEGAGVAAQAVPLPIPEPMPTPLRQQTSDLIAPDADPFTSTNVEDEPLGGSFRASPPRSTQAPPAGHTLGGAEDLITLTALSSVVSTFVHKVNSLETELKAHKKLFKDVVPKLVKKVKTFEPDVDLDALNALVNAAVTVDSTKSPGGPSRNPASCSYDPTSDVPSTDVPSTDVPTTEVPFTEFPTDIPSGVAPTGPSTVSPGSTTVPTRSSVPAAEIIPASSATTTVTPSSPVRDAQKGKGVAVEEPTPTSAKTFKQLEEERLSWEAAQRLQAQDRFRKQSAKSTSNQGPAVYSTGWTMAQVRKLSPEQLQEEFGKIQRAVAFIRGLKRYAWCSQEEEGATHPQKSFHKREVAAPLHFQQPSEFSLPPTGPSAEPRTHSYGTRRQSLGARKKQLGRKGVHTSHSTIPIEDGDPEAEHKMCIKYASDEDYASDDDTSVNLFAVVDSFIWLLEQT